MMGHSGYLETDRRALVNTLRRLRLPSDDETVNRYRTPFEDTPFQPDFEISDFAEMADALLP